MTDRSQLTEIDWQTHNDKFRTWRYIPRRDVPEILRRFYQARMIASAYDANGYAIGRVTKNENTHRMAWWCDDVRDPIADLPAS